MSLWSDFRMKMAAKSLWLILWRNQTKKYQLTILCLLLKVCVSTKQLNTGSPLSRHIREKTRWSDFWTGFFWCRYNPKTLSFWLKKNSLPIVQNYKIQVSVDTAYILKCKNIILNWWTTTWHCRKRGALQAAEGRCGVHWPDSKVPQRQNPQEDS